MNQVLEDVVTEIENEVTEGVASSLAKVAIGGLVAKWLLRGSKKTDPSVAGRSVKLSDLVKAFNSAKDQKQLLAATVGLLGIGARVLLRIPDLRDLGFRIQQVVDDSRLEEFLED